MAPQLHDARGHIGEVLRELHDDAPALRAIPGGGGPGELSMKRP